MEKKYVKDGKHNKFPAYCCEDIDNDLGARVKQLEEALEGLVAGIMPDGSVTLAKLANDARTYVREINQGRLISEWIGTQEEYDAHVAENGGEPLPNVRYTIQGVEKYAQIATDDNEYPVGSVMSVLVSCDVYGSLLFRVGDTIENKLQNFTNVLGECQPYLEYKSAPIAGSGVAGKWRSCGKCGYEEIDGEKCEYYIFQRIE